MLTRREVLHRKDLRNGDKKGHYKLGQPSGQSREAPQLCSEMKTIHEARSLTKLPKTAALSPSGEGGHELSASGTMRKQVLIS